MNLLLGGLECGTQEKGSFSLFYEYSSSASSDSPEDAVKDKTETSPDGPSNR